MPPLTSTAREPSPEVPILQIFNKRSAKGIDVSDSLEMLKQKVSGAFPSANWIFDLTWNENGDETIASGRPYQLG